MNNKKPTLHVNREIKISEAINRKKTLMKRRSILEISLNISTLEKQRNL